MKTKTIFIIIMLFLVAATSIDITAKRRTKRIAQNRATTQTTKNQKPGITNALLTRAVNGSVSAQDSVCTILFEKVNLKKEVFNSNIVNSIKNQADAGQSWAQDVIGELCFLGSGGYSQNLTNSIEWYRKAAEQGLVWGQLNLALRYKNGEGIGKNLDEANKWFLKAVEHDNSDALYEYAQFLHYGPHKRIKNINEIEQGTHYLIRSVLDDKFGLDLTNCIMDNGNNLIVFFSSPTNNCQKWSFKKTGENNYIIQYAPNPSHVIDVRENRMTDGEIIHLWDESGYTNTQKWIIKSIGNEKFVFQNSKDTNYVLDLYGAKAYPAAPVRLHSANGGDNQAWYIEQVEDKALTSKYIQYYQRAAEKGNIKACMKLAQIYADGEFVPQNANMALNYVNKLESLGGIEAANYENDAAAFYDYAQLLRNMPGKRVSSINEIVDGGIYRIRSVLDDNFGIDLTNCIIDNGNNIIVFYSSPTNNCQKWSFKKSGNSSYIIQYAPNKSHVIDVRENRMTDGEIIHLWDKLNNTNTQKWIIKSIGNEKFVFQNSKDTNYVLDLYGANAYPAAPVRLHSANGGANQAWYIDNIVNKDVYLKAMQYYKKAAELGHVDAMVAIADIYYFGSDVVDKNYTQAMTWYRKAAEKGNNYARDHMGWAYIDGDGVTKNYKEARKWLELALKDGYQEANSGLRYLEMNEIEPFIGEWVAFYGRYHDRAINLRISYNTDYYEAEAEYWFDDCYNYTGHVKNGVLYLSGEGEDLRCTRKGRNLVVNGMVMYPDD